jgi:hypothetical protein
MRKTEINREIESTKKITREREKINTERKRANR